MNKKYGENEIELIRRNAHLSIKDLVLLTGLTKKQIIYIKQRNGIYKDWNGKNKI